MDLKLEVIGIPVSDVDTAKAFYTEQVGFHLDHDVRPAEGMRVVQMTPPGSACSVVIGEGMPLGEPGSTKGPQLVVADIDAAREALAARCCHQPGPAARARGRPRLTLRVLHRPRRQRLVSAGIHINPVTDCPSATPQPTWLTPSSGVRTMTDTVWPIPKLTPRPCPVLAEARAFIGGDCHTWLPNPQANGWPHSDRPMAGQPTHRRTCRPHANRDQSWCLRCH